MNAHIDLAHQYWARLIQPGDTVIDATCGNGHDTLALAKLPVGKIFAIDLQPEAIRSTRTRLKGHSVTYIEGCHSTFPEEIGRDTVRLIVYNLGYLPGGDKTKTTMTQTTLESIKNAQELIMNGGAISITCYPGHPEGKREEEAILEYVESLDPALWSCWHHRWINRYASPSLLLLQKLAVTVHIGVNGYCQFSSRTAE